MLCRAVEKYRSGCNENDSKSFDGYSVRGFESHLLRHVLLLGDDGVGFFASLLLASGGNSWVLSGVSRCVTATLVIATP